MTSTGTTEPPAPVTARSPSALGTLMGAKYTSVTDVIKATGKVPTKAEMSAAGFGTSMEFSALGAPSLRSVAAALGRLPTVTEQDTLGMRSPSALSGTHGLPGLVGEDVHAGLLQLERAVLKSALSAEAHVRHPGTGLDPLLDEARGSATTPAHLKLPVATTEAVAGTADPWVEERGLWVPRWISSPEEAMATLAMTTGGLLLVYWSIAEHRFMDDFFQALDILTVSFWIRTAILRAERRVVERGGDDVDESRDP